MNAQQSAGANTTITARASNNLKSSLVAPSSDVQQLQSVKLDKQQADRFLTSIEVSKVHALFGDSPPEGEDAAQNDPIMYQEADYGKSNKRKM